MENESNKSKNVEMDIFGEISGTRPIDESPKNCGEKVVEISCRLKCIFIVIVVGCSLSLWGVHRVNTNIAEYCSFKYLTKSWAKLNGTDFGHVFELENVSLSTRSSCHFNAWNDAEGDVKTFPSETMSKWTNPFKTPFSIDLTEFNNESFWFKTEFATPSELVGPKKEIVTLPNRKEYKFEQKSFLTFFIGNLTSLNEAGSTGKIAIKTEEKVHDFTVAHPDLHDLIPLAVLPFTITIFSVAILVCFFSVEKKALRRWSEKYEVFDSRRLSLSTTSATTSLRRPSVFGRTQERTVDPNGIAAQLIKA